MTQLVTKFAAKADTDQIIAGANAINKLFEPNSVNLTNEQLTGLRTMSQGREGVVRLLSSIATQNINSLPRNEDPADLASRLEYYTQLQAARQAIMPLFEMLDNTQNALGGDIMQLYDRYYCYLQAARSGNTTLDLAMAEIDEWNKRFGERPNTGPTKDGTPIIDNPGENS